MPKFRKKPIVIEAVQWWPGVMVDGLVWVFPRDTPSRAGRTAFTIPGHPAIKTLEGEMEVSPGDWIITGVKGEKYPCKPDIFAATYEAVD